MSKMFLRSKIGPEPRWVSLQRSQTPAGFGEEEGKKKERGRKGEGVERKW